MEDNLKKDSDIHSLADCELVQGLSSLFREISEEAEFKATGRRMLNLRRVRVEIRLWGTDGRSRIVCSVPRLVEYDGDLSSSIAPAVSVLAEFTSKGHSMPMVNPFKYQHSKLPAIEGLNCKQCFLDNLNAPVPISLQSFTLINRALSVPSDSRVKRLAPLRGLRKPLSDIEKLTTLPFGQNFQPLPGQSQVLALAHSAPWDAWWPSYVNIKLAAPPARKLMHKMGHLHLEGVRIVDFHPDMLNGNAFASLLCGHQGTLILRNCSIVARKNVKGMVMGRGSDYFGRVIAIPNHQEVRNGEGTAACAIAN